MLVKEKPIKECLKEVRKQRARGRVEARTIKELLEEVRKAKAKAEAEARAKAKVKAKPEEKTKAQARRLLSRANLELYKVTETYEQSEQLRVRLSHLEENKETLLLDKQLREKSTVLATEKVLAEVGLENMREFFSYSRQKATSFLFTVSSLRRALRKPTYLELRKRLERQRKIDLEKQEAERALTNVRQVESPLDCFSIDKQLFDV